MSELQDHFAGFLRDRAAADAVLSVKEELLTQPHQGISSAMIDGLKPYYLEIMVALATGDAPAISKVLTQVQLGGVAIGYAFAEHMHDLLMREEIAG